MRVNVAILPTAQQRSVSMPIERLWAVLNHHYETCGFCTAYYNCPEGQEIIMDVEEETGMPVVAAKVA